MDKLKKIALLLSYDAGLSFELDDLESVCKKKDIELGIFEDSDSILDFKPDCVLVASPQDAKLTPFPTYGLINRAQSEYLELPRYIRNILTYDGYLSISPILTRTLKDIMFGLRKLGSDVFKFDFYSATTEFTPPRLPDKQANMVIFEPNLKDSKFKQAIKQILNKFPSCYVLTSVPSDECPYSEKVIIAKTNAEIMETLHRIGIVICLDSGLTYDATINTKVIKAIAASSIVIAQHTKLLEEYFGESLYYIPNDTALSALTKIVDYHITHIKNYPDLAVQKAANAHQIFLNHFALDKSLDEFVAFHQQTLVNKGYVPNPDPEKEKILPSVSYIIRTGGTNRPFLERTLACLQAQNYPDLCVILVTHIKVPYVDELVAKYPTLKFKVVERIKSRRSEAIRDGMAAVETELFGLYDDDDEIFPNHVRTLVKTMQYHHKRDWRGKIGMVYSGSIHADDTHPVPERGEYRDHKWVNKQEKRAIEHYRLYSSQLMSQHKWFMPNGWLARSEFIDEELLTDPGIDTCEDLYFELQIAQRGHFAFSAEVTAIHNFHHFGNSTIEDSHKHIPDTERIALRNFARTFPGDIQYDWEYNLIGKPVDKNINQLKYQDQVLFEICTSWFHHTFFPFRLQPTQQIFVGGNPGYVARRPLRFYLINVPKRLLRYAYKFILLDRQKKSLYMRKILRSLHTNGLKGTYRKGIIFLQRQDIVENPIQQKPKSNFLFTLLNYFNFVRLFKKAESK